MPVLSVRLLGPPQIQSRDADVRLPSVKAQGLLYYLAAQPVHPFSRSHLVSLLWEDSAEAEGRNTLSTVLTRLRHALPVFPVAAEGDTLVWRPGDAAWVDTDAFAAADATLSNLRAAAALWRGSFLDGFGVRDSLSYDEWLTQARQHWEQRYLDLLARLVAAAEAARDWPLAQTTARQALALDPLQERFYRALMTALYQAGDRAAALAEYEACVRVLDRELGTVPDRDTRALYDAIRDDRLPRAATRPARAVSLAPRAVRAPSMPLLERQREMDDLLQRLAQAQSRRPNAPDTAPGVLVVIEGEAGIGKSRLLAELTWRLSQGDPPGWTALEGHCYEAERSLPYHPFVDALSPIVAGLDVASLGLSDVWLAEVARLLPDLAAVRTGLGDSLVLDPSQDQRRLFEAVARFLAALPAPLLFILDDLHWADAGTLQLLSYLVRHLAAHPIQFLAAARSEDTDDQLRSSLWRLEREGRLATLDLARLSPAGTRALLRQMVASNVEALASRLYQETAGNPLFTVEIVRSLQESGRLDAGHSAGRLSLPASVTAVIQGRLTRLSPTARNLLAAASVFRRDFSFEAARNVSSQTEDVALDALDELRRASLLVEVHSQAASDDDVAYAFSHDKIREVVYSGLSHARSTALHRRAVAALGAADDARAAERLAYHAYHGRLWADGLRWSEAAGVGATAVFDFASAALLYQQALACLAHLPVDNDLRRKNVELRLMLARVAFYIEPGRLTEWLAPAEADAQRLGSDQLLSFVWLAQGSALYIQGRFGEARPLLERLIPLMERTGDSLQVARAKNILARTLSMMGESDAGLALLDEAATRLDMVGAHNDALISRGMIGAERSFLGEFDAALQIVEDVYQESLRQADPGAIAAAADFVQVVHHCWGHWAEARDWGYRALEPAQRAGNRVYERNVYIFLGLPLAFLGDVQAGRDALDRAIALGAECQSSVFMGRTHAWLAEVRLLAGDAAGAAAAARTGMAIAAGAGARYDLALARRALGRALMALDDLAAAETELTTALTEFQGLNTAPSVARTLAALAHLAHKRGDSATARRMTQDAAVLYTRLSMDWDLARLPDFLD